MIRGRFVVPLLVALPAVLVLFGGRWITRISLGGIYLLDFFLVLAVLVACQAVFFPGARQAQVASLREYVIFVPLFVYAIFRWFLGPLNELSLRDLYPFALLLFSVAVSVAMVNVSKNRSSALVNVVLAALILHWIWVALSRLLPDVQVNLGEIFQVRGDLDGALIGVLGVYLLNLALKMGANSRAPLFLLSIVFISQVPLLGSRSSVVATFAVLLFAIAQILIKSRGITPSPSPGPYKELGAFLTGTAALVMATSLISGGRFVELAPAVSESPTVSGQATESGVDSRVEDHPLFREFTGTTGARVNAWIALYYYSFESPNRALLGEGMGSPYLRDSGAADLLLGKASAQDPGASRHPHNAFLHIVAILGWPAALYAALLFMRLVYLSGRVLQRGDDRVGTAASYLFLSLSTASAFGVIFEGPYGAVPLAWSVGVIIARTSRSPRQSLASPSPKGSHS